HPVRLGLAARRGRGAAARLREGALALRPRRAAAHPARELPRAARRVDRMNFALSEEQELLQGTLRAFVARECTPQVVRAIFDGERQSVPALWKGLAEIGVAGLAVPESYGGAGLELLELALVAEELGRGAVPVPFLGHALATLALV